MTTLYSTQVSRINENKEKSEIYGKNVEYFAILL